MSNPINVHKYVSCLIVSVEESWDYFHDMIEWVMTNVGPPESILPNRWNASAGIFSCCGVGWKFAILNFDDERIYSKYQWYMVIDNDSLAVAFKLLWP